MDGTNNGDRYRPPWDRLYALTQSMTRGMMEKDTVYPAVHHIYELKEDGKYHRLCDNRYWGTPHARVLDEPPFGSPPIPEGWEDKELLGDGYSCTECAEVACSLHTDRYPDKKEYHNE